MIDFDLILSYELTGFRDNGRFDVYIADKRNHPLYYKTGTTITAAFGKFDKLKPEFNGKTVLTFGSLPEFKNLSHPCAFIDEILKITGAESPYAACLNHAGDFPLPLFHPTLTAYPSFRPFELAVFAAATAALARE